MKTALLQLCSGDDPVKNLVQITEMMCEAAGKGAGFILTPEVCNCVSQNRARQVEVLRHQTEDNTLKGLRQEAASLGVWLSIGSLALKTSDADGRFANRSFMIDPTGKIVAQYDKIHMFDVDVSPTERYRESDGYRAGDRAVLAETAFAKIGLSVCYDMRFPHLYRDLAKAGAEILLAPSAFSPATGRAHWETLLRARAIENGAYVLAAAQSGHHPIAHGRPRETYGHSLAISPWGEVLSDGGTGVGINYVDFDRAEVAKARGRIGSLTHDRPYEGP